MLWSTTARGVAMAEDPTAPLPGDQAAPPTFATAGPPREALADFWRRLAAAFLDWILVGIVAAAIGDLFGVEAPVPPSAVGDRVQFQPTPGPFVLAALVYFTYFHATSAGQSIGNRILGIPRRRPCHDIAPNSLVVRAGVSPPGEFARPAR